jgi:glucose-1-phosphate thymidylyltransferase
MKALILAAGYATRLYPLTRDFPKPLLEVGGKTILDHLLDQIIPCAAVEEVVIITNHRFAGHFERWRQSAVRSKPVAILDDGTGTNEDRLGAIGDVRFAIRQLRLDGELFVCAADNIVQFPLAGFLEASTPAPRICVRWIEELEARRRTGIVTLDASHRVLSFEEKPREPKSHWGVPPLYVYPRGMATWLEEYLEGGGKPDAPGNLVAWLCQRRPVYGYRIEGTVLDIGSLDSLERARAILAAGHLQNAPPG